MENSNIVLSPNVLHPGVDAEKLKCSLEALVMSQTAALKNQPEPVEPDLSECKSCKNNQSVNQTNNPGGEEPVSPEGKRIPAKKKNVLIDTGQIPRGQEADRFGAVKRVNSASLVENKPKKEDWKNSRCNSDVSWNPATSQSHDVTKMWKMNKTFNRGSSRIRLISSSNSLNASLPRLTSHHSSSDEEWFEEVAEGDDDVLQVTVEEKTETEEKREEGEPAIESSPTNRKDSEQEIQSSTVVQKSCEKLTKSGDSRRNSPVKFLFRPPSGIFNRESKTFSIFKRLTEGRKESQNVMPSCNKKLTNRESFENLIVDPSLEPGTATAAKSGKDGGGEVLPNDGSKDQSPKINTQNLVGDVKSENEIIVKDSVESWETIELGDSKQKEAEKGTNPEIQKVTKENEKGGNCCCTLQ